MVKKKIQYVCQQCGFDSPKWLGHCPACNEWNTMVEEVVTGAQVKSKYNQPSKPLAMCDIDSNSVPRMITGIGEFDRVLGGGIVPGALVLIGGDPGIGKSTLLLAVAGRLTETGSVLYVSGEESAAQTRLRADRLGTISSQLFVMTETNLEEVLEQAVKLQPKLVIIDSIQTMYMPNILSAPGSVGQVRESTAKLLRFAKETHISIAIIGHVTKEGNIAGPRLLEHMVDVVLYFEGEKSNSFRILRAIKNRFGSTAESGIFSMEQDGLAEVKNPSSFLLSERQDKVPGSVILACIEGIRPLMIEIQALVTTTPFGMPRRMAAGFDYNRLVLLMAVLEKRAGLMLGNQDAYVNAVGGIKVAEPAADLAVLMAVASSFRNVAIDTGTVVIGEVGLTGEVRKVAQIEPRIREAIMLGFNKFIIPKGNMTGIKINTANIEIIGVDTVNQALATIII